MNTTLVTMEEPAIHRTIGKTLTASVREAIEEENAKVSRRLG